MSSVEIARLRLEEVLAKPLGALALRAALLCAHQYVGLGDAFDGRGHVLFPGLRGVSGIVAIVCPQNVGSAQFDQAVAAFAFLARPRTDKDSRAKVSPALDASDRIAARK